MPVSPIEIKGIHNIAAKDPVNQVAHGATEDKTVSDRGKYLASAGMGLSFRYAQWLTGELSAGFPLKTVTPDQDDYQLNFRVTLYWAL